MIALIPINGLCNRMRAMDSAVSLCRDMEVPIRIYWTKEPDMNCAFADLFEPIPNIEVIESDFGMNNEINLLRSQLHELSPDWIVLDRFHVKTLEKDGFDFKELKGHHVLMSAFIRFYPTAKMYAIFVPIKCLQQRIDKEYSHFHQHTIGVHIRRTDNVKSIAHSPTELFECAIEKEIALNPNVNFYLACDCSDTKQQLHRKYGEQMITNFNKSDRTSKEGIQQALVELYALSRTKKIIGSYWSSFSHTAADISGIEEITLYVQNE
jgi:hypothetical protein